MNEIHGFKFPELRMKQIQGLTLSSIPQWLPKINSLFLFAFGNDQLLKICLGKNTGNAKHSIFSETKNHD